MECQNIAISSMGVSKTRSKIECTAEQLELHALRQRAVEGKFDEGHDQLRPRGLLLGEVEAKTRIGLR
jgi:hypothetical protein